MYSIRNFHLLCKRYTTGICHRNHIIFPLKFQKLYYNDRLLQVRSCLSAKTTHYSRFLSTTKVNESIVDNKNDIYFIDDMKSVAPFPIRVLLVFLTSTIGTPLYSIGGAIYCWYRILPKYFSNIEKFIITSVLGIGILGITKQWLIPFFAQHGDIVIPFALCNGIVASTYYILGELLFGLEFMTVGSLLDVFPNAPNFIRYLPIAGSVVGILTVITVPFFWNIAFDYFWGDNLKNLLMFENTSTIWIQQVYDWFLLPVCIPIGALAGLAINYLLRPLIFTTANIHWNQKVLLFLIIVSSLIFAYITICKPKNKDYVWILRTDLETGSQISYNLETKESVFDNGTKYKKSLELRESVGAIGLVGAWFKVLNSFRFSNTNAVSSIDVNNIQFKSYNDIDNEKAIEMNNIIILYSLIDRLVRYRYLETKNDKADQLRKLETEIKIIYGISNVENLLAFLNHHIITSRTQDKSLTVPSYLFSTSWISPNANVAYRSDCLKLLGLNLQVYEAELLQKMNYVIEKKSEETSTLSGVAFLRPWVLGSAAAAISFVVVYSFMRQ